MPGGHAETLRVEGGVPGQVTGVLSDFNTGGHNLLPPHTQWLDHHVVPIIDSGGSLSVQGWASPMGSEEDNLALSRRRAASVVAHVRGGTTREFRYLSETGTGEEFARAMGVPDGANPAFFRAVLVTAWPRPTPPPITRLRAPAPVPVPRTVFRRWREVDVPQLQTDDVVEAANYWIGQAVSRLEGRQDDPPGQEQRHRRRQQLLSPALRVNRMEIRQTVRFQTGPTGNMQEVVTEVTYHYGPPAPQVHVTTRRTVDLSGILGMGSRPPQIRTNDRSVPRAQADRSSFYNPMLIRR